MLLGPCGDIPGDGGAMKKRCRHNRAWPTVYCGVAGILWCSDCGARREIKTGDGNSFKVSGPWIYPRGHDDVLNQYARATTKALRG